MRPLSFTSRRVLFLLSSIHPFLLGWLRASEMKTPFPHYCRGLAVEIRFLKSSPWNKAAGRGERARVHVASAHKRIKKLCRQIFCAPMILKASSISSSLSSVLEKKEETTIRSSRTLSSSTQSQNLISRDPKQTAPRDYFAALLSLRCNLYLNSASFFANSPCIVQSLNVSTCRAVRQISFSSFSRLVNNKLCWKNVISTDEFESAICKNQIIFYSFIFCKVLVYTMSYI